MSAKLDGREPLPRERWTKYLTDYNEGLGLVYERLVLNDFLSRLCQRFCIKTALEAPLFGMAGVSGINSVELARTGVTLTIVDDDAERLAGVSRIWSDLHLEARFVFVPTLTWLPFESRSFDLSWNWAALWYLNDPAALLKELARVTRRILFIAMPNRAQVGYLLRKYILEREFVKYVDEKWADIQLIKTVLQNQGCRIVEEGVLDVPPWPDTVMPASQVLGRLGLGSMGLSRRFQGESWNWSTMDYYLGRRVDLKEQIEKYTFIERAPIPWQFKVLWAHHRYVVAEVGGWQAN